MLTMEKLNSLSEYINAELHVEGNKDVLSYLSPAGRAPTQGSLMQLAHGVDQPYGLTYETWSKIVTKVDEDGEQKIETEEVLYHQCNRAGPVCSHFGFPDN